MEITLVSFIQIEYIDNYQLVSPDIKSVVMSKIQKEYSLAKIIYKASSRKKDPVDNFRPFSIRVNNFYCRRSQLEKFTKGFSHPNELPSFAFVATFKLVLQCLAQSNITSNLMGLIHLNSDFNIATPHNWLLPTDIEVSIKDVTKDEKGLNYLVVTKLFQNGEITIINSNRMLDKDAAYRPSRSAPEKKPTKPLSKALASTVLSLKTAWFYAWMSKDFNPIHLHPVLAKQFGLKRALIHGMFNLHFSLKHILKSRTEKVSSIKVQFNRPCFLPNQIFLKNYTDTNEYGLFGKDQTERFLKIQIELENEIEIEEQVTEQPVSE